MRVHTCEPADPASKGGSESTVKLAKADLVPKDTNLREEYASFAELEEACALFSRDGQRAGTSGDPPRPDRHARRRTGAAPPAARAGAHGVVRGDPHRRGEHGR